MNDWKGMQNTLTEQLREMIPLRRYGKPHQVAAAILFLASEYADFITGTFLNISGGW